MKSRFFTVPSHLPNAGNTFSVDIVGSLSLFDTTQIFLRDRFDNLLFYHSFARPEEAQTTLRTFSDAIQKARSESGCPMLPLSNGELYDVQIIKVVRRSRGGAPSMVVIMSKIGEKQIGRIAVDPTQQNALLLGLTRALPDDQFFKAKQGDNLGEAVAFDAICAVWARSSGVAIVDRDDNILCYYRIDDPVDRMTALTQTTLEVAEARARLQLPFMMLPTGEGVDRDMIGQVKATGPNEDRSGIRIIGKNGQKILRFLDFDRARIPGELAAIAAVLQN